MFIRKKMPPDWGNHRTWRHDVDLLVAHHQLNPELPEVQEIRESPRDFCFYNGPQSRQGLLDALNPHRHVHRAEDGTVMIDWATSIVFDVRTLVTHHLPNVQFDRVIADCMGTHLLNRNRPLATFTSGALTPDASSQGNKLENLSIACMVIEAFTGTGVDFLKCLRAATIVAERYDDLWRVTNDTFTRSALA